MSTAYSPGGFQNGLELLGQHHVALDLQLAAHEGLHAIQLAFCHGHEVSIRHGNGAVLAPQGFEQSGCNDSEGSEETQGTARPQDDLRFRQHCPLHQPWPDPLPFFQVQDELAGVAAIADHELEDLSSSRRAAKRNQHGYRQPTWVDW